MAGLCTHCVTGSKLEGTPKGAWITGEGGLMSAYYASAKSNTTSSDPKMVKSSKAIVLIMDAFAFGIPNSKLLADILAETTGQDVWVPDIFRGQVVAREEDMAPYMEDYAGQNLGMFKNFMKYWILIKVAPTLIMNFRPSIQDPWIVDFIANLRKDYGYERIGLIGYCWGGGSVSRLSTMPGVADTAIPVHPSGLSYKWAISKSVVPVAYFTAEEDPNWDPRLAAQAEAQWKGKEDAPKHWFKTYPGTTHGFGVKPNLTIPRIKESFEELMNDIVKWFGETL